MNKTKVKIIAGVLVVFFLGFIIGVLGTGVYIRRQIRQFTTEREPGTHKTFFMRRLSRELELTAAQRPEVEKIVEAFDAEMRELLQQSRAEFAELLRRRNAQLKDILSPEQQEKLDDLEKRIQDRWHPPPPPPPGDHRPPKDRP